MSGGGADDDDAPGCGGESTGPGRDRLDSGMHSSNDLSCSCIGGSFLFRSGFAAG